MFAQPSPCMHETCVPGSSTSFRCTWKRRSESSPIAATGSYDCVAHQPVSTAAPSTSGRRRSRRAPPAGVFSGWFSSPKRTPCARSTRRRALAIAVHDLADARDEVDVEIVREAAGGGQLVGRRADAAGEGDDAEAVTSESLARERDVLGRRPAPVEMPEPEVDRVEADAGDRREQRRRSGSRRSRAARTPRSSRRRTGPTRPRRRSRAPSRRSSRS